MNWEKGDKRTLRVCVFIYVCVEVVVVGGVISPESVDTDGPPG